MPSEGPWGYFPMGYELLSAALQSSAITELPGDVLSSVLWGLSVLRLSLYVCLCYKTYLLRLWWLFSQCLWMEITLGAGWLELSVALSHPFRGECLQPCGVLPFVGMLCHCVVHLCNVKSILPTAAFNRLLMSI